MGAASCWPFFGLRVHTARLELRYPSDEDLLELARVAAGGVHDPAVMPFAVPWTDAPPGELERRMVQYHWATRGALSPEDWRIELVVVEEGRIVGAQGMGAKGFASNRTVVTGSWLGRAFQGRGIGREMRAAILDLAVHGLGARVALSGAFVDNTASQHVSAVLGYRVVATDQLECRGVLRDHLRFQLDRSDWLVHPHRRATWEGLEGCFRLLGATMAPAEDANDPRP